jgi:D-lactate dehydrogenase
MDAYFYEAFAEETDELRRLIGDSMDCGFTADTIQESKHTVPPAPLISIRTQSIIPETWAPRVRGILSRSTGYDHLLAYRAVVADVPKLGYLEEYSTRAVAEHALLLVAALLRKLPQQMRQFSRFDRDGLTGRECLGTKLLVVGVGRIGSEIVKVAGGMGFDVRGVDIIPNRPHVSYVSAEQGLAWAEVIVCAMNLTNENRGYFSQEKLRRAPPGLIFVNIARGEHAPLIDLLPLCRERHLGGVGLDVFDEEPSLAAALRHPSAGESEHVRLVRELLDFPNVILTPHNAFNSEEAVARKSEMTIRQIQTFLQTGDFLWKV